MRLGAAGGDATRTGHCDTAAFLLLCALIDPGADDADLFGCQRFWGRTESTGTARTTLTGRAWSATIIATARAARRSGTISATGSARTAGTAWATLGRHGCLVVDLSGGNDEDAVFAIARNDDFSVFAALEDAFEVVEAQIAFGPLLAVAAQT